MPEFGSSAYPATEEVDVIIDVLNSAQSRSVSLAEGLPLLIIIGASVGGGCVFIVCVITLVSICCRHTAKGEVKGQMLSESSYSLLKKHDTVEIKRTN